ncbi:MAG TPA: thioredoxin family protein [Melioribacteraceae bacterium]|nr:thioredoxin family protein [Melioribacteraceae bacterium]
MKKSALFPLLIIFLYATSLIAQSNTESKREKFDPSKDPFSDLKTAVEKAAKENKRIILDVGGEWCIWCHRLDAFIDSDEEIKNFLTGNYIVIKVNFSPENKNEKFLSQFPKINGYPHMFVLEKDGKFLHSQDTGLLEKDKSYSREKILEFLKEWAPEKS